ncbi:caspase-3-like [Branchiostoma floridae x Branchiostoma japonicum]
MDARQRLARRLPPLPSSLGNKDAQTESESQTPSTLYRRTLRKVVIKKPSLWSCLFPNIAARRDQLWYRMKSEPRGLAFILNNKHFDTMKVRHGSDCDSRNMEHLLKALRFTTVVHRDLTAEEILSELRKFSLLDHSDYDCCAVVLLSHGNAEAIFGTDGKPVSYSAILQPFDGQHCKPLINKPKLFFMEACRGDMTDSGADEFPLLLPFSYQVTEANRQRNYFVPSNMPNICDIYFAFSTVPGYTSWRNSQRGSWFVQSLIDVFAEHAAREDLCSLMTRVNQKVALSFESQGGKLTKRKQVPAPVNMLTKKLFFFPEYAR